MTNSRSDFVGPILLAIFAYLASMLTRAFQRSIEQTAMSNAAQRVASLNYTVTDAFITDQTLLNKLQDVHIWEECNAAEPKWWNGKTKPKNIWEELSEMIWEGRSELEATAGFEYWCDILSDGESLPWHIDKDEVEFEKSDNLITPLMGSVYFGFEHRFDNGGGHFYLIDADTRHNPHEFDVSRRDEIVAIASGFNRLIHFNASKWHRVSGVTGGKRYTFAVNANSHKPKVLTKHTKQVNKD
eukprot:scaffold12369_cov256-Chaetoceros_neogracile.AAC.3